MLSYTLLPEVEDKISRLLEDRLKMTPELILCDQHGNCDFKFGDKSGHESGHHYYLAKAPDGQGGKQILKVQIDQANHPDHVFIRHKNFVKEQRFSKASAGKVRGVPEYIDSGCFEGLNWLVYRYVPGEGLGMAHTTDKNLPDEQIQTLRTQLAHFAEVDTLEDIDLPHKTGDYYKEHLKEFATFHHKVLSSLVTDKQLRKLTALGNDFAVIIDSQPSTLVHGDFHPGNIIIDPNGSSINIIDWEHVHLGTPIHDLAMIWNRCWKTSWRNKLIRTAREQLNVRDFDAQLQYLVLHLLLDELIFWDGMTREPDSNPLKPLAEHALELHKRVFAQALDNKNFWNE